MAGLEDLYREIILDHYRNPRNRGELPCPPARRIEGFNPLCGDEVVVYVTLSGEGAVDDIRIGGQGCSISQSSASMMSAAVKGRSDIEARRLVRAFKSMMSIHDTELPDGDAPAADNGVPADGAAPAALGDLEALQGVVKFPVRIKCATLPWNALLQALDEEPAS